MTATLSSQSGPANAVRFLFEHFSDLPAAELNLSRIYPDCLTISLHSSFAEFETWREALDLDTRAVTCSGLSGNTVLKASGTLAGTSVELVGYGPQVVE